jgi:hypothetical protein
MEHLHVAGGPEAAAEEAGHERSEIFGQDSSMFSP